MRGDLVRQGRLNRLDESIWVDIEDHKFHEVEGDHKEVGCPKCTTPLEPISPADAADLIIDRCQKCEGFWLDRGELDRVVQIADQEHSKLADNMVLLKKPHDWSSLRWFAHLLKCHYQKK